MHWLRPSYTLSQLFRRDPFRSVAFCHGPFAAPLSVYSLLRSHDSHQTNDNQQQQQQQQQQQSACSSAQTQVQDNRNDSWLEKRRRHKQRLHHLRFHHDPLSLFDSISPFSSPLTSLLSQPSPFWPGFGRTVPDMTVDFFSTPSTYSVHAAVPGLDKRDIKVTVEDGVLKIEAERREERKERSPTAASSSSIPVSGQQSSAAQATPEQGSTAAADRGSASAGSAASTASADGSAGEKAEEAQDRDESVDYHHVESYYGRVERSLALPEDADADRLTARYENGVIKIDIPRLAQHKKQPRRIDIQ